MPQRDSTEIDEKNFLLQMDHGLPLIQLHIYDEFIQEISKSDNADYLSSLQRNFSENFILHNYILVLIESTPHYEIGEYWQWEIINKLPSYVKEFNGVSRTILANPELLELYYCMLCLYSLLNKQAEFNSKNYKMQVSTLPGDKTRYGLPVVSPYIISVLPKDVKDERSIKQIIENINSRIENDPSKTVVRLLVEKLQSESHLIYLPVVSQLLILSLENQSLLNERYGNYSRNGLAIFTQRMVDKSKYDRARSRSTNEAEIFCIDKMVNFLAYKIASEPSYKMLNDYFMILLEDKINAKRLINTFAEIIALSLYQTSLLEQCYSNDSIHLPTISNKKLDTLILESANFEHYLNAPNSTDIVNTSLDEKIRILEEKVLNSNVYLKIFLSNQFKVMNIDKSSRDYKLIQVKLLNLGLILYE